MGNNWGTALSPSIDFYGDLSGSGDVVLPTATKTTIVTFPGFAFDAPGVYYPVVFINLAFTFGATPPTALRIAINVNGGTDLDFSNPMTASLVGNANLNWFTVLAGATSRSLFVGAGCTLNVTGLSTAQATTVRQVGSYVRPILFRTGDY